MQCGLSGALLSAYLKSCEQKKKKKRQIPFALLK